VTEISIERIENAIHTVARMMLKHDMPELIATIRYLEAARDDLLAGGDPAKYEAAGKVAE
jgi:HAMP domain-containing protein